MPSITPVRTVASLWRFVIFVLAWNCASPAFAGSDLAGEHDCALYYDSHPCTLTSLPDGGYSVKQVGHETFEGTLTPKGLSFHLDGFYKFEEGNSVHLLGEIERRGSSLEGRVKIDSIPHSVAILPAKAPKPVVVSKLSAVLGSMTSLEAVKTGSKLPLRVEYFDAPRFSFSAKTVDEKTWKEKLQPIFGMVLPDNNAGIECKDTKLRCKLTAQSGADVWFYFTRAPTGVKLTRIVLPAEGD
jgi:hypothetical protein